MVRSPLLTAAEHVAVGWWIGSSASTRALGLTSIVLLMTRRRGAFHWAALRRTNAGHSHRPSSLLTGLLCPCITSAACPQHRALAKIIGRSNALAGAVGARVPLFDMLTRDAAIAQTRSQQAGRMLWCGHWLPGNSELELTTSMTG